MLNKKEIIIILIVSIVLAFIVNLMTSEKEFFYALLAVLAVISINVFMKKITSFFLDSEIEVKLWEVNRFWFRAHDYFKKPLPAGIIAPVVLAVLSLGYVKWMAVLVFDVKAKVYRAARRFQLYTFSEMTEYHIGLIAASGIIANLIFGVLGYLFGFSEFARISLYYSFFNMIPLSDLDGNKVFFGSLILWSFLATLVLLGVVLALLVV
jgi:hypothetical protein